MKTYFVKRRKELRVIYANKRTVERALFALDAFSRVFGTPHRKADACVTVETTYVN